MSCTLSPVIDPHTEPAKMTPVAIVIVEIVPLTRCQHRRPKQRRRRDEHVVRMGGNEGIVLNVTRDPFVSHAGTPDRRRRRR